MSTTPEQEAWTKGRDDGADDTKQDQEEWKALGTRLREARTSLGLRQETAAAVLEVPRSAVSAMEHGQRKVYGHELRRLARLYQRPVGWLLGDPIPDSARDGIPGLAEAIAALDQRDRAAVLRFAEFLRHAGPAHTRTASRALCPARRQAPPSNRAARPPSAPAPREVG